MAIVTGTSGGIGNAVASLLLAHGWAVVGVSRREVELGSEHYAHIATDLSEVSSAARIIQSRIGPMLGSPAWSRIALVNNAASADSLGIGESIGAEDLERVYSINTVMPVWLMGFVARRRANDVLLRIVNVSSGAATRPFPGLLAYGGSKAALRMSGMILCAEWESTAPHAPHRANIAIRSYEPGVVDTDMQRRARSLSAKELPWGGMFHDFVRRGSIVDATKPAAEIVEFLEADGDLGFTEARLR